MSSAASGRRIGKAASFSARRGRPTSFQKPLEGADGRYHEDCRVNQGTSFSDIDRAAANHNGLAGGAAAATVKGKASRRKLTSVMKSAAASLAVKRSGVHVVVGFD